MPKDYEQGCGSSFTGETINDSFRLVVHWFKQAYKGEEDDSKAIKYLEDIAEPLIRNANIANKDYDEDSILEQLESAKQEAGRFTPHPFQSRALYGNLKQLYEEAEKCYDSDEFDYIVGVYASGIPPMALVGDYFEGEEVVVRYSQGENDSQVLVSEEMKERLDSIEGASMLVVDESRQSGRTLAKVGDFFLERDASDVRAMTVPLDLPSNTNKLTIKRPCFGHRLLYNILERPFASPGESEADLEDIALMEKKQYLKFS